MAKTKLSNGLVGGFGGGGGSLVLSGLIRQFASTRGISLELFLIFELVGIFLISIAVYIHFKY